MDRDLVRFNIDRPKNVITNYYTLKALAETWDAAFKGWVIGDIYSQSKDELSLAIANPENTWILRACTRAPFRYIFSTEGYNKARRNVATVFKPAFDAMIERIHIAHRDRIIWIDLSNGLRLQYCLFGSRANVFLVDGSNKIVEAFQQDESHRNQPAPASMPAQEINTLDEFLSRWQSDASTVTRALSRALPFLNATLAREAAVRANIETESPADCGPKELRRLYMSTTALENDLLNPEPRIYWDESRAEQFSLVHLSEFAGLTEERFEKMDQAVSVFVKKKLGQHAFDAVYLPLEKALANAHEQANRRLSTMLDSLSEESRADRYERWGHLLMASSTEVPAHADSVPLDDLFGENQQVVIPLDPALNAIENAQRYYEKARQTRLARSHAEERLEITENQALETESLLSTLRAFKTRSQVVQFQKDQADRIAPYLSQKNADATDRIPFRRYILDRGYEVWVGKNARQNDALTFDYARKFDFWLHARGVPGSHTVLRRPGRTTQPDKHILEQAAAIAAYHSKARGSALAPVIVTEKKYVRKPRGAAIGTVVVEREQVLLVEPGLPAS